jgi:hypothetical protein
MTRLNWDDLEFAGLQLTFNEEHHSVYQTSGYSCIRYGSTAIKQRNHETYMYTR